MQLNFKKLSFFLIFFINYVVYSLAPISTIPVNFGVDDLEKKIPWKELVRELDDSNPLYNLKYWQNCIEARSAFDNFLSFMGSKSYSKKTVEEKDEIFKNQLIKIHKISVAGAKGDRFHREFIIPGQFRMTNSESGFVLFSEYSESVEVAKYIDEFNDNFAQSDPFNTHNIFVKDSPLILLQMDIEDIPRFSEFPAVITSDKQKMSKYLRQIGSIPYNFKKIHFYPDMAFFDQYARKMRIILEDIIQEGHIFNVDEKLKSIAEFYQIAINLRPFDQINNSMFMNMSNHLIRKLGLKGISHGILDHVAFRMQPENFQLFFAEKVKDNNNELLAYRGLMMFKLLLSFSHSA